MIAFPKIQSIWKLKKNSYLNPNAYKVNRLKPVIVAWFCLYSLVGHALEQGAVASAHPLATQAGIDIIKAGGNAFDAAVTVAAVLAVVEPYGSGLGGGGFWLLKKSGSATHTDEYSLVDARETAPVKAHPNMFVDNNRVHRQSSVQGPLSAAIPGTPAALVYVNQKYGRLSLAHCLAPAIRLAREGFVPDQRLKALLHRRQKVLAQYEQTRILFLNALELEPTALFKQPDLARVLHALSEQGHKGFYQGEVAHALVNGVQENGGIWTLKDLRDYQLKIREPIVGTYNGRTVITTPAPSAGGITLLTVLKLLERLNFADLAPIAQHHLLIESFRRAYCDRAKYLADPDFVNVPMDYLLSEAHLQAHAQSISRDRTTPSRQLECGVPPKEGHHTTHFSIIDPDGNTVGATLTLNHMFGSGFVPKGTGVLLNNEMDDFAIQEGVENQFGLIGHKANLIEPGKRPLSSMAPTFVEDLNGFSVLGVPGGSRIPTMLILALLEMEVSSDPRQWVTKPRFHHQYLPDVVSFEPKALPLEIQAGLREKGHRLQPASRPYGNMQVVHWNKHSDTLTGASDPRGIGHSQTVQRVSHHQKAG